MPNLRVLVVDDAVVMRRLVSEVLERAGGFEVAATAPNGRIALQKLTQVNPDVVTLDVEMPEMDGLQTLREIRRTHPRLPVIMFSLLTQRGAVATLDALAAGASDYVTKPTDVASLDESIERLQQELVPKLRAHCRTSAAVFAPAAPRPAPSAPLRTAAPGRPARSVELLCLATSTGGPNALAAFFERLAAAPSVPVAIVQHMPPMFTQMLASRLDAAGHKLRCQEAADGQPMLPGHAYLAPGGRHLAVERSGGRFVTRLVDTPPENSCRPAADVLFRSAVAAAGPGVLAVVMTGMGCDGQRGCEFIREAGGQVLAQDEATSVVWGMPGSVVHAGLADAVLPLNDLPAEVLRRLPDRAA